MDMNINKTTKPLPLAGWFSPYISIYLVSFRVSDATVSDSQIPTYLPTYEHYHPLKQ